MLMPPQIWHRRISPLQGKSFFPDLSSSPSSPSTTTPHKTITNHLHVCYVHTHAVHSLIPAIKMNQADLLHILYIHLHNVFAAEEPADHQ